MMRARGLSAFTITRLYCNPIKLWQNGLRMIYSAVYVQCSLLCIFPLAHVRVHVCLCMCGCWVLPNTIDVRKDLRKNGQAKVQQRDGESFREEDG